MSISVESVPSELCFRFRSMFPRVKYQPNESSIARDLCRSFHTVADEMSSQTLEPPFVSYFTHILVKALHCIEVRFVSESLEDYGQFRLFRDIYQPFESRSKIFTSFYSNSEENMLRIIFKNVLYQLIILKNTDFNSISIPNIYVFNLSETILIHILQTLPHIKLEQFKLMYE